MVGCLVYRAVISYEYTKEKKTRWVTANCLVKNKVAIMCKDDFAPLLWVGCEGLKPFLHIGNRVRQVEITKVDIDNGKIHFKEIK